VWSLAPEAFGRFAASIPRRAKQVKSGWLKAVIFAASLPKATRLKARAITQFDGWRLFVLISFAENAGEFVNCRRFHQVSLVERLE
jgi:hypothetical protein